MTLLVGKSYTENHNFEAPAIMPDGSIEQQFSLNEYIQGYYAVIFFYSLNFSFVCPTELMALANREKAFHARYVRPVVVSCDSYLSHMEWRNKAPQHGGIGNFPYPLVSDTSRGIAKGYGCLVNDSMALRGTYIVDKEGYFRHQSVNDFPTGRNIDEIIRILDALMMYRKTGKLAPAGWTSGQETVAALPKELASYMSRNVANL